MSENSGILRVYGDQHRRPAAGRGIGSPGGEHLAHLLAWAIEKRVTVFEALQLPFYHPVLEEGLQSAFRDLSGKTAKERPRFELALCESSAVGDLNSGYLRFERKLIDSNAKRKGLFMSEVTTEKLLVDFNVLIDDAEQLVADGWRGE